MTPATMSPASAVRRDRLLLDPQEHARLFAGWEQRYDQISHGPFRSRLVEIEFADIISSRKPWGRPFFRPAVARATWSRWACFPAFPATRAGTAAASGWMTCCFSTAAASFC